MIDEIAEVGRVLAEGVVGVTLEQARVTGVNAGPPKTLDIRVNDKFDVPRVRYSDSITAPTNNDAVMVLAYGTGKRFVLCRVA